MKTTYNGFWSNGTERLVVNRTTRDREMIQYRKVDENGKAISKLHKGYAAEVLPSFVKEGSNEPFKLMYI